jgi:hypothetical protein
VLGQHRLRAGKRRDRPRDPSDASPAPAGEGEPIDGPVEKLARRRDALETGGP